MVGHFYSKGWRCILVVLVRRGQVFDESESVLVAQTVQQELLASDTVAQSQVEMIHCYMHLTEELVFL
jgi:hypothetical protein